ncbi:unnamed protein product [Citrullus colocynthis]|uniref:Uncharacterized protein n=1 Tax=Citrullus colocynthis TaxID=252529 RepID=A0ABP0YEN3_9ROSI
MKKSEILLRFRSSIREQPSSWQVQALMIWKMAEELNRILGFLYSIMHRFAGEMAVLSTSGAMKIAALLLVLFGSG